MTPKTRRLLSDLGSFLILLSLGLILFTFFPAAKEEVKYKVEHALNVKYSLEPKAGEVKLTPPNTDFSVVIPKIAATAPIIDGVDSQDPKSYLPALLRGVAHAKGTMYPQDAGNVYLFAHSTDAFYNVGRYNAVFYLIGKLENGDEIDVFYKGQKIKYQVYDKKVVEPNDIKYLGDLGVGKTLTLQTCYPPGTTLKRLVVLARQVE